MFNLSVVFQKNENKQSSPTTTTNPNTTQPTAAKKADVLMSQFLASLITKKPIGHPLAKKLSDLLSKPHTQQAVTDNTSRVFNATIQNKNTSNEAQTAPSSANQDQEVAETLNAVLNQVDEQNKSEQAEQAVVRELLNELVGQVGQTSAADREPEMIPLESEVEPTAFDDDLANAPDDLFDSPPPNRIEEEVVNSLEASAAGAALPPIQEDAESAVESTAFDDALANAPDELFDSPPSKKIEEEAVNSLEASAAGAALPSIQEDAEIVAQNTQPQQPVSQSQPQPKNISQQLQFGSSTPVALNPPPNSFEDFGKSMALLDTQIKTIFPVVQAFQSKPKTISQQLQFGSSTPVALNPPPTSFEELQQRMTRLDTQIKTKFPVAQAFQSKPKQTFFDMFKAFFSCLLCLFCFRRDDAAGLEGF